MAGFKHGWYIGPETGDLKPGATCLVITDLLGEEWKVRVQFDANLTVGKTQLHQGWHTFPARHFEIAPEVPAPGSCGSGIDVLNDPANGGP